MGIGTSLGQYFDDEFHFAANKGKIDSRDENIVKPGETKDVNEVSPDTVMKDRSLKQDPKNVFDDQGNMVDYQDGMSVPNVNPFEREHSSNEASIVPVSDIKTYGMNPMIDAPEGTFPMVGGSRGPEKIKSPAIKVDNEIITGENHGIAFGKYMDKYPDKKLPNLVDSGFTTTHGRFVSREDAMDIARNNNQLNDKAPIAAKIDPENPPMLLSEDLL